MICFVALFALSFGTLKFAVFLGFPILSVQGACSIFHNFSGIMIAIILICVGVMHI